MMVSDEEGADTDDAMPTVVEVDIIDPGKAIAVTDDSFVCLKKMHPVRGFFVNRLISPRNAPSEIIRTCSCLPEGCLT